MSNAESISAERKSERAARMKAVAHSLSSIADRLESLALGEWKKCPLCDREFTGAFDICPDCNQVKELRELSEERIKFACGGERGYREFTPERFHVEDANRTAYTAALEFDGSANLYLCGETGTGKSHLAGMIGRRLVVNRMVLWVEPIELMRSLRGLEARDEAEEVARYSEVPILIIDELGVSKDTEFALTMLYQIINNRWRSEQNGLVITSNLSPDELASKMGDDRLVSRLVGMCQVIKVGGSDHRLETKRRV